MTDEQKAKISAKLKGKPNHHKGYPCSASTRAKISAANLNPSLEIRAKISSASKGHIMSPEARAKLSVARIGHVESPETRAKVSAAGKGRFFSLESRAKKSVSMKGKKNALGCHRTDEWKAKMSVTMAGNTYGRGTWQGGPQVSGRKAEAKRRLFGFQPLNSCFSGSDGHHINKNDVIYIPRKLHHSVYHNQHTGQGMIKINALAGQYLTEDWT